MKTLEKEMACQILLPLWILADIFLMADYGLMENQTMQTVKESPAETLERIRSGCSQNDAAAVHAFGSVGIHDAIPRVNVLTYRAWQAAGRQVRRGERGVKVPVFGTSTNAEGETRRFCRSVALFHISQTELAD